MFKKIATIALFASLVLPGCFIADSVFVENASPTNEQSLQKRAELSVKEKIESQLKDEVYTPYGFSTLKVLKPIEIIELEELEKAYAKAPTNEKLKTDIEEKKDYITTNNIERRAELDHFYTLILDTTSINIAEVRYTLNDTLGVVRAKSKITLSVPKSYQLILDYYFNEYTIFIAQSYAEGRKMSKTFYRFFKDKLETYDNVKEKSAFLKHTLDICLLLKQSGKFDQNRIAQSTLQRYIREMRPDIQNYTPLAFSDLYETTNIDDNSTVGYYFFHKFIGTYAGKQDTNSVVVEFSPHYQIDQVSQLEVPFESLNTK